MEKLVIFDLDGTLINTIADLARSTNYALEACGFPVHKEDEYRFFVGNGIRTLFKRALPPEARTEANILRIRDFFLSHYNRHHADKSRPYPGIPELLKQLQEEGYKMAVASNKYQLGTEQIVSSLLPGIGFEAVLGQREGVAVKPDPTIIHEILQITGIRKEETLYVGDSGVDMLTARNAGVTACGVTWGFRTQDELEEYSPQFIIHRPEEIHPILERLVPKQTSKII